MSQLKPGDVVMMDNLSTDFMEVGAPDHPGGASGTDLSATVLVGPEPPSKRAGPNSNSSREPVKRVLFRLSNKHRNSSPRSPPTTHRPGSALDSESHSNYENDLARRVCRSETRRYFSEHAAARQGRPVGERPSAGTVLGCCTSRSSICSGSLASRGKNEPTVFDLNGGENLSVEGQDHATYFEPKPESVTSTP